MRVASLWLPLLLNAKVDKLHYPFERGQWIVGDEADVIAVPMGVNGQRSRPTWLWRERGLLLHCGTGAGLGRVHGALEELIRPVPHPGEQKQPAVSAGQPE